MNRIATAVCILAIVSAIILVTLLPIMFAYQPDFRTDARFVNDPTYDITVIDDFLTAEECNNLRDKGGPHMFQSAVYGSDSDNIDPNTRISEQCWLKTDVMEVNTIRKRIFDAIPTLNKSAYLEDVQLVKYKPGGFFTPHYDACVGSSEYCKRMDKPHGPRYITVLIYLSDDGLVGGQTVFPRLNKTVTPKVGRAVVFYNVTKDGSIIEEALHGGEPVISGEKWIANQWIRIW